MNGALQANDSLDIEPQVDFFRDLYGEDCPWYLIISIIDKRGGRGSVKGTSFRTDSQGIQDAAHHVEGMAKSKYNQIYFSLGLQEAPPPPGKRGPEENVIAIPGFGSDLDILGPGHKEKNLPTREEAFAIIESFPLKPSFIVDTGGGLQLFWLLNEPWIFNNPEDRAAAKSISDRLQRTLQNYAPKGKKVDAVGSLEHLFRIPGTFNQKLDTPRPVKIIEWSGERYNPDDIEQFLIEDQESPVVEGQELPCWDGEVPGHSSLPKARPETITKNCSAMRWLVDNPEDHTEPQWKLFVDTYSHCEGGRDYVHQISKRYPKYDFQQTEKKIDNALKVNPRTCKKIREVMAEECEGCRQKVKAPAVLGLPPKPEPEVTLQAGPYDVIKNALYHYKETPAGYTREPVANCWAAIEKEVTLDDGVEQCRYFEVKGKMNTGEPLAAVRIPANQFPGMAWITTNWGAGPVIYAGQTRKDHFRCATQMLNPYPDRKEVVGHTGWRKYGGTGVFCHGGGAIGDKGPVNNFTVELSGPLAGYELPDPPDGTQLQAIARKAISKLLHLTDPDGLAATLFCCIGRAPLAELRPIDFSVAVTGGSGAQKTSATVIAQSFFGASFNHRKLPGNWSSTANALEKAASQAKDVIFMVDDFAPSGAQADVQRLHRDADRLLRGVGNQGGRLRMRADSTLRPEYHARGLLIITGEDLPRGHSLRARLWTVEVKRGDVNLSTLTELQMMAADSQLAGVMSAYIKWLAGHMDKLKETVDKDLAQYRDHFRNTLPSGYHDRVPENISNLLWGGRIFLEFLQQAGAITRGEMQSTYELITASLTQLANQQSQYLLDENPALRFISLIRAAFLSGQAHVIGPGGTKPHKDAELWGWEKDAYFNSTPRGDRIGWFIDSGLYLEPEAAFKTAQKMAQAQGGTLPLTQQATWKRLKEAGMLASYGKDRCVVRFYVQGIRHDGIHVYPESVFEKEGIGKRGDDTS